MDLFESTFSYAQRVFGLTHYHVTFADTPLPSLYADIDVDPGDCIATVRYDSARCALDGVTEATATHEVLHLLLADLLSAPGAARRVEEERVVRRLEAIVIRGIEVMRQDG